MILIGFGSRTRTINYKKENNTKSWQQVLNLMDILNLIDIFRENNPKLRRYLGKAKTKLHKVDQISF